MGFVANRLGCTNTTKVSKEATEVRKDATEVSKDATVVRGYRG